MHTMTLIFTLLCTMTDFVNRLSLICSLLPGMFTPPGINITIHNANHKAHGHFCGIEVRIYVDCLLLLDKVTMEAMDIPIVRAAIETQAARLGISMDELRLDRIDYAHSVIVEDPGTRALYLQLWDKASGHFGKAIRSDRKQVKTHNTSYFICENFHVQIYDKTTERTERKRAILPHEQNVLRLEYQVLDGHLHYWAVRNNTPRTFDEWATWTKRCRYLQSTAALFFPGDFYTVRKAMTILRRAGVDDAGCQAIRRFMTDVSRCGVDYATARAPSPYYARKYIQQLSELAINPIPIPQNAGVPVLPNPFRQVLEGGAVNA